MCKFQPLLPSFVVQKRIAATLEKKKSFYVIILCEDITFVTK